MNLSLGSSQYKDSLSSNGDSYYKDKTIMTQSYLYHVAAYTGKSLYWDSPLVIFSCTLVTSV